MKSFLDACRPLATPRLKLREPRADHAPLAFEAFSADARVTRFLRWRPQRDLCEAEAAMGRRLAHLREISELSWVVFRGDTNAVVGVISLWPLPSEAELGFALAHSEWGKGFASEAARAVLDWAFERPPVDRVWASCAVENLRSQRVLEKLGMIRERVAPAFAVHPNISPVPRDCAIYAITRSTATLRADPSLPVRPIAG